jgi:hypothetical protein
MGEHPREWGISPQKGTWKTGILVANTGDTRKKMRSQGEQLGKQLPKAGDFYIFLPSRIQPYVAMVTFKNLKPLHQEPTRSRTHPWLCSQANMQNSPRTQQKKQDLIPNRRFFNSQRPWVFPTKRCHFHSISWFKRLYISKRLMGWTSTNSKNGVFSNGRDFSSHMRRSWWKLSPTSAIDLPSTMLHNL